MNATRRNPHIVFIVLDTQRLDRLGCYGYQRGTSPNLDAFAREATLFENAIAPAQWTIPSHASMFSGEPPTTHMTVQSGDILDTRFQTLAQRLQAHGYRTVAYCNNPLVGVVQNGFKRGGDADCLWDGLLWAVPAGIVGARLWFVANDILGGGTYYLDDPMRILNIPEGGLHIYGAFLFGGLAYALYAHRHRVDMRLILDSAAPPLLIGQGLARLGNWINQDRVRCTYPAGALHLQMIRHTRKVSQGEGFFLSAKDQPFQARYIEVAV